MKKIYVIIFKINLNKVKIQYLNKNNRKKFTYFNYRILY